MSEMTDSEADWPEFLFISLTNIHSMDDPWSDLFFCLSECTRFLTAESETDACRLLSNDGLRYVLIGDADILFYEFKELRDGLVQFARNGGTVVHACKFATQANCSEQAKYFQQEWGLPWEPACHDVHEVFLNPYSHDMIQGDDLPLSYLAVENFLQHVAVEDAVYVCPRVPCAETSPLVPVALTKIGSGYMGYVGEDCDDTDESNSVILALFGLPFEGSK